MLLDFKIDSPPCVKDLNPSIKEGILMQDYSKLTQSELRKKAGESFALMGRRIQAFRDTLAAYLIPEEGIEKYTVKFMGKKQELMNSYMSRRLQETQSHIDTAALVIIEIAFLDSSTLGELNLEELTPLSREYLRDILRAQIELMQKASEEYLR